MFVSLWHYLKGYVIVEVSGYMIEKFLNLALHHHIPMWDVVQKENKICFKTPIEAFKCMKPDLKKAHCRAKIVGKKGFPFIAHRYKKRRFFVAGIVVFIAMLWLLSSFVWLVEVEGTERINSLDIIKSLEKKGYETGKLKSKMNLREAETYLLQQYPDIVWTGITYEGTRMMVRVAESVPKPEMSEMNEKPKMLIAKRDALVTYIAVEKGKPLIKAGDIVKKGELLVTGEMPRGEDDDSLYYTAAKAHIKGKTTYTASGTIQFQQEKKQYLNESSKKWTLKLFNKAFQLYASKPPQGNFDKQITLHQLRITKMFPLPFAIEVENRVAYKPMIYTLSEEDAKDRLLCELWEQIEGSLGVEAQILKREAFFKKTGDAITGTLHVIAEEDIGYRLDLDQGASQQIKEKTDYEQN